MLDKEAEERGTTVYLVNKRVDMLPKLLGENILATITTLSLTTPDLCSLMSNVDRYAFSVIWVTPGL